MGFFGAGPPEVFRFCCQAGVYGIRVDISRDPIPLGSVFYPVIVAFVLPERATNEPKDLISRLRGKTFDGVRDLWDFDLRRYQEVDVIGHDHPGVKVVPAHLIFAVAECFSRESCDLRLVKVDRAAPRLIQERVHRQKSLPAGRFRRESAIIR